MKMTDADRARYPEHAKLEQVADKSQTCGNFLNWLLSSGRMLAVEHKHTEDCEPAHPRWPGLCGMRTGDLEPVRADVQALLGEFFRIDQRRLAEEKDAMFRELQAASVTAAKAEMLREVRPPRRGPRSQKASLPRG